MLRAAAASPWPSLTRASSTFSSRRHGLSADRQAGFRRGHRGSIHRQRLAAGEDPQPATNAAARHVRLGKGNPGRAAQRVPDSAAGGAARRHRCLCADRGGQRRGPAQGGRHASRCRANTGSWTRAWRAASRSSWPAPARPSRASRRRPSRGNRIRTAPRRVRRVRHTTSSQTPPASLTPATHARPASSRSRTCRAFSSNARSSRGSSPS